MLNWVHLLAILAILIAPLSSQGCDTKSELDQLLSSYREYRLPLPPPNAALILCKLIYTPEGATDPQSPLRVLAFLTSKSLKDPESQCLRGLQREPLSFFGAKNCEVIRPDITVVDSLTQSHLDFVVAIQCHSRGWFELSSALLSACKKGNEADLRKQLARCAWEHWTADLTAAETDWKERSTRLDSIINHLPSAFDEHHRQLVRAMKLTLITPKAKGGIELLLDDLLDEQITGTMPEALHDNLKYQKLALAGFDAVPVLLNHLDDQRLTRIKSAWFNNSPGFVLSIQHVASLLLQDLAGHGIGVGWAGRQTGQIIRKRDAETWWSAASKDGEEEYFVRRVLGDSKNAPWPNRVMISVIGKKYPKRLSEIYARMIVERPNIFGRPVVRAILDSPLSEETMGRILKKGLETSNLNHRADALSAFQTLDLEVFHAVLISTLSDLPRETCDDYLRIASLASQTANSDVWDKLIVAARRADGSSRVRYLALFRRLSTNSEIARRQLLFLAQFLSDSTACNSQILAKNTQVRHVAVLQLAIAMGIEVRPASNWTEEELSALEDEVRRSLHKKGLSKYK